jgi:hypothetical protein
MNQATQNKKPFLLYLASLFCNMMGFVSLAI